MMIAEWGQPNFGEIGQKMRGKPMEKAIAVGLDLMMKHRFGRAIVTGAIGMKLTRLVVGQFGYGQIGWKVVDWKARNRL